MNNEVFEEREFTETDEQRAQLAIATASMVVLSNEFSNDELAALNLAIQLQGRVPKENLAFAKALEFKLIKDDGSLWDADALKRACAAEVMKRHEAGTFK